MNYSCAGLEGRGQEKGRTEKREENEGKSKREERCWGREHEEESVEEEERYLSRYRNYSPTLPGIIGINVLQNSFFTSIYQVF